MLPVNHEASLSRADEFNFLSIVMSYLIRLRLIFISKGCLLLPALSLSPLTGDIFQNYPGLDLFA